MKEIITIEENFLTNLNEQETYKLENALTILNNKDIKDKLTNELITRKDLKLFKVIKSGGNPKKEIQAIPIDIFINYFLNMCLNKEINLIDYLDFEKIKSEVGTIFDASYFKFNIFDKTQPLKVYLKKIDGGNK